MTKQVSFSVSLLVLLDLDTGFARALGFVASETEGPDFETAAFLTVAIVLEPTQSTQRSQSLTDRRLRKTHEQVRDDPFYRRRTRITQFQETSSRRPGIFMMGLAHGQ